MRPLAAPTCDLKGDGDVAKHMAHLDETCACSASSSMSPVREGSEPAKAVRQRYEDTSVPGCGGGFVSTADIRSWHDALGLNIEDAATPAAHLPAPVLLFAGIFWRRKSRSRAYPGKDWARFVV